MVGLDREGRVTLINRTASRLLGVRPEDVETRHYSECMPELAGLIRQGELDDRSADLHAILKRSTRRRLQIANPGYAPEVA